jgi:arginase
MKRKYHVIGANTGWGAQIRDCEMGPEEIVNELKKQEITLPTIEMLYPKKRSHEKNILPGDALPMIQEFNLRLFHAVKEAVKKKLFPVVLGGDHSIAVGTWNGFNVPFGLLWIDAHMDGHTPDTSPSQAYHGMPLAALLGHGAPEMSQLVKNTSILKPQNVALIGARSFEKEELDLFEKLNVKIYFIDEVQKRGFSEVLLDAISHITQTVSHYGISLDLDAFSIQDAPGVGSPAGLGINKKEFLSAISCFSKDPRLIGFEMVELNPKKDIHHKTCLLAVEILKELFNYDPNHHCQRCAETDS